MARRPIGSVTELTPYADGSPRFRLSIETANDFGRKRINRNVRAKDGHDAERQLRALLDAEHAPSKDTIADVAERWKAAKSNAWKPSTAAFHLRSLNYIIPLLGAVEAQAITADMANRFYALLRKTGKPDGTRFADRSIHAVHETLRAVIEYSIDCGLRDTNPIRRAHPGPRTVRERPELPSSVLAEIIDCANPEQIRRMLLVAAVTGLRPAELCALRWKNIDLENGRLTVSEAFTKGLDAVSGERVANRLGSTKTRAGRRTVALDEATVTVLQAQGSVARRRGVLTVGDTWVWPGRHPGQATSTNTLSAGFQRAAKAAGHDGYHLYDLRRWAVTQSFAGGHSEQLVMQRVGHTTVAMTGHYATRSDDADRRITATLSKALGNA